jgi:hypothetical protein
MNCVLFYPAEADFCTLSYTANVTHVSLWGQWCIKNEKKVLNFLDTLLVETSGAR